MRAYASPYGLYTVYLNNIKSQEPKVPLVSKSADQVAVLGTRMKGKDVLVRKKTGIQLNSGGNDQKYSKKIKLRNHLPTTFLTHEVMNTFSWLHIPIRDHSKSKKENRHWLWSEVTRR